MKQRMNKTQKMSRNTAGNKVASNMPGISAKSMRGKMSTVADRTKSTPAKPA